VNEKNNPGRAQNPNPKLAVHSALPDESAAALNTGPLWQPAVLVVDDSRTMRIALIRALDALGFKNITEATNGRQALELVLTKPFDLMLLDMEMPEMNGMEVLIALEKVVWVGKTLAANNVKVDGFNFDGAGTYLDPKYLDGGATAGKWDTYGKAAKDLNHLHSLIKAAGGTRIALFYPITAEEAFGFPYPTSATSNAATSILDYAKSVYEGGVFPVCNDRSALCCMTGAAEVEGSFQIVGASLDYCKVSYTQEPMQRVVPYNDLLEIATLRYDARIVPTFVTKKIGAYYYKMVAEIDSIDLST
jgi:hypothetical protein